MEDVVNKVRLSANKENHLFNNKTNLLITFPLSWNQLIS